MSKNNTISLSLVLIAFLLCFQANASFLFGANPLRSTIMNAHANSSGIVELQKDSDPSGPFYVEADLAYDPQNPTSGSNSTTDVPKTVKMMISIPNVESMIVTMGCFNFSKYDCSKYNCKEFDRVKHIDYPSFSADGYESRSDMCLDYNYWSFADSSDYLYTTFACQSNGEIEKIGTDRYGVLGLGTGPRSKYQYRSSKNFSIYIESDLKKGKLLFKNDKNSTDDYVQSPEPLSKFLADTTWQLKIIGGSIKVGDHPIDISGTLAFDINSDVTALPYNTFERVLDYLRVYCKMSCDTFHYKPTCNSTQKIQDLPNITIVYNGENINIPPKIYASVIRDKKGAGNSSFSLNFKAIASETLTGKSYATPSFENSIIFGANFMSYYYTVFDFSTGNNLVYLYTAKHPDPPGPGPNPDPDNTLLVIIVLVGIIVLIGLCCYCAKKKRNDVSANNSTNTPLIYNGYQQPQGTYPTYNAGYQQQPQGGIAYAPAPQERAK